MRISDWSSDVCSSDLPGYSGERPGQATSGGRYYSPRFPPHLKHNRISGPPVGIVCPIAPRRCIVALVLDEVQFGNRVFSDVIPFPFAGIDAPDFQYSRNTDSEAANRCPADECYDAQHVMQPPAQEKPWRNQSDRKSTRMNYSHY